MAVKHALIIGASRGLGLGLVEQLLSDGWKVTATVRQPAKAQALAALGPVHIEQLEMDDHEAIKGLSQKLDAEVFDLVFVNAGIIGPKDQTSGDASLTDIGQLFLTNSIAPINMATAFVSKIRKGTGVLAFMSSGLGSITAADAPELALYKASKAALNSMTNTFVSRLDEDRPTVLTLHPGWVKTEMGGDQAEIDVGTSTRGLVAQVNAHAGKGGHYFIDYTGKTIPW